MLVAKRPKSAAYELLQKRLDKSGIRWALEIHGKNKCVLVDTVARFKGLEAQAVILWVGDEDHWETLYVGTTRAKSLLVIVGPMKVINALKKFQDISKVFPIF